MQRLLKYKVHHLLFWGGYHYAWWTIAMGNPVKSAHEAFLTPFFIKFCFYVVFATASVCFNLYVLMPRYLEKNRVGEYIAGLSATVIMTSILIIPGYYITAAAMGLSVQQIFQLKQDPIIHLFFGNTFPSTLASMTLGMSIRLTSDWIQSRRRQQLLEKEKLESELKFLKYQFNPHFLFNTINSIFFLIHKNPDKASASLAKFSELLRHQLYECNDMPIVLSREIAYLENFIQLQRLRQNDNVEITFRLEEEPTTNSGIAANLSIAPFILMTFVENAFKHVSTDTGHANWIRIDLQIQQQQLNFSVANSCSPENRAAAHPPAAHPPAAHPPAAHPPAAAQNAPPILTPGGIGLTNVRRRLELLYPGGYQLDIQDNPNNFNVKLQLQLSASTALRSLQKIA